MKKNLKIAKEVYRKVEVILFINQLFTYYIKD